MFERTLLKQPEDYFLELDRRGGQVVYCCRLNQYSDKTASFIAKYYETARLAGVVIEGRIPNPTEKNLSYYEEVMGTSFQMSVGFLSESLRKWLPRMGNSQRGNVAAAMYDVLDLLRRDGKNENMLKNAYIKFMCWLYYKFERITGSLGQNAVPKILYEGDVSKYELMLLAILAKSGCDVLLLQYRGDANYRKTDPALIYTQELTVAGGTAFPQDFNLKWLRQKAKEQAQSERIYGAKPSLANCTNAWITGKGLEDIKTAAQARGSDPALFYNCLIRITGTEDKLTYLNELYQFHIQLKNSGRKVLVLEQEIPVPTVDEIASIRRKNYTAKDQMLLDLSANIPSVPNRDLQGLLRRAFLDILSEEEKSAPMNLNKLTNKAVYLLCWIRRYQSKLFANWKMPEISCLIYLGVCKNSNESMFLRFLARLPVDVLVLNPDLNKTCCLKDSALYELSYRQSLSVSRFPVESSQVPMATTAYHAERELDSLLYRDSGIYRSQQYGKANAVSLQTTYEEIGILWDQELKYRPNFSIIDEMANLPVLFAKISGIKDGQVQPYWSSIQKLVTQETLLIRQFPHCGASDYNPVKAHAAEFFKNGKLLKSKIKEHPCYPYGFLREEMQEHILDKLAFMIDQRLIRGTFENGTEYTLISVVLNLEKGLTRMLQKFDFTKKNPKLIYVHTTEAVMSLEDAILAVYLHLAGFDVLLFVPTGYSAIERYLNKSIVEEHQIGEYVYDLEAPEFSAPPAGKRSSWRDKIFKRGN